MSYVPFLNDKNFEGSTSPTPLSPGKQKTMKNRQEEQKLILDFVEKVFGTRSSLTLEQYKQINNEVSSEMFYSIMRVLHNTIPCTKNFFR